MRTVGATFDKTEAKGRPDKAAKAKDKAPSKPAKGAKPEAEG